MAKNQPNHVLITQEHIHFINFGCFCYDVLLFWNADVTDYFLFYIPSGRNSTPLGNKKKDEAYSMKLSKKNLKNENI